MGFNTGTYPLDIEATVVNGHGAVVYRGDIVQIEAETIANLDGANAVVPVVDSASPETIAMWHGVVMGTAGKLQFQDGEEMRVKILGVVEAYTDGGSVDIAAQDYLYIVNDQFYLQALSAEPDVVTALNGALATAAQPNDNAAAVASSATLTALDEATAFAVSHSIDANTLAAGDWIDIFAMGRILGVNGTDDHTYQLRFDGDVIVSIAAASPVTGQWQIWARVQIRTATTYVAAGHGYQGTEETFPATGANPVLYGHIVSTAFDNTVASTVDVLCTHAANSAGNQSTLDMLIVEVHRSGAAGLQALVNELRTDVDQIRGPVQDLMDLKRCKAIAIDANAAAAATRSGAAATLTTVYFNGMPRI